MKDAVRTGRIIGVMLLLVLAGLMVGFMMLDALRSTDYLTSAAANSSRIKTGAFVLLANCFLAIAISIAGWRVFREYSVPMALWLIVLAVIMFVMQAIDTVQVMSTISLSQHYLDSGGDANAYNALAASVRSTRRWAHYFALFTIDLWLGMLYAIVLRFGLVSRILAGAALAALVMQFLAVPVAALLGYGINTNFGIPMALGILAFSAWLIVRGMRGKRIMES